MIPFIDLAAQQKKIRPQLDAAITKVLDHGRYIMGPEVPELEERLADYVGVKHCIGVSSGTDSLLIAMMALGIGPGDEVITVPYTWISTAEMIALLGAKPVFVDIEPDTWNMDPTKIEAEITVNTKAIMPVGIYGQAANMTAINEIAARHGNLPVIEDAAQCFGATHRGKHSCALATIGSTSFFPSKPLGCYGDGGALFTDDDEIAQSMRQIRVHGQAKKHHHPLLGLNGRLDTIQAAITLCKLDIFDEEVVQRQAVAERYGRLLGPGGKFSSAVGSQEGDQLSSAVGKPDDPTPSPISHLSAVGSAKKDIPPSINDFTLPFVADGNTSVYAQYTILSSDRDTLNARLKENGIPSVSYYAVPLHLQPVFSDLGYGKGDFPVAEKVANQGLSLPMSPGITEDQQELIANVIQPSMNT